VLSIVGAPFAYRFSRWMIVLRMKRGNLRYHQPPKTDST
jgi:hypothetical protein